MQRKTLSSPKENPDLDKFAGIIKSCRYFRKISLALLKEMLRQGEFVTLKAEEFLLQENHSKPPELIVLLEGSLAVTSKDHFIMRLNHPGDVVGEMSVISANPNPYADVIAEEDSQVVIFPNHLFKVAEDDTNVSVAYYIFSHILAEKLRHVTARSLLKKNGRSFEEPGPMIGILDPDIKYRGIIKSTLQNVWKLSRIIELESYHIFLENPFEHNFDFIIIDPELISRDSSQTEKISNLIEICSSHLAPMLVISQYCKKEENRQFLAELGVTDFLLKPLSAFDLQHLLIKFRKDHYRQQELEQVEIAADTDRLTGLANRRRMDEFLEAMLTLFPEEKQSFSLIIADVDHFKHYNDAHGHQLGDVVLASVAAIFKNSIRRGDLAARFGGEEFVVILPNCEKDNAMLIANKMRETIAAEKFPYQQQQPLGNLTCTFGVATFPEDADTKELLLKKADDCLYKGKAGGRNKVLAAE
ncbi:MAG: diguanylate cyclase [SAR324 cluster bacterium]|nr:diguanylate cyclase [SAR324 cluster bacterium]